MRDTRHLSLSSRRQLIIALRIGDDHGEAAAELEIGKREIAFHGSRRSERRRDPQAEYGRMGDVELNSKIAGHYTYFYLSLVGVVRVEREAAGGAIGCEAGVSVPNCATR